MKSKQIIVKNWRFVLAMLLPLSILPSQAMSGNPLTEGEVLVGLIYKVALFVRWPENAFENKDSRFSVCVFGQSSLSEKMELIKSQELEKRPIALHRLSHLPNEDDACHILFVDESKANSIESMRHALHERPLLTFSNIDDFADHGGMVTFSNANGHIEFDINSAALKAAGLSVDGQLMRLTSKFDGEKQ